MQFELTSWTELFANLIQAELESIKKFWAKSFVIWIMQFKLTSWTKLFANLIQAELESIKKFLSNSSRVLSQSSVQLDSFSTLGVSNSVTSKGRRDN
jgi:hypothetical protein